MFVRCKPESHRTEKVVFMKFRGVGFGVFRDVEWMVLDLLKLSWGDCVRLLCRYVYYLLSSALLMGPVGDFFSLYRG